MCHLIKGFLSVDSAYRLPTITNQIENDQVYIVGYFVGSSFRKIYECDLLENAQFLSGELQKKTSYQTHIFCLTIKIKKL